MPFILPAAASAIAAAGTTAAASTAAAATTATVTSTLTSIASKVLLNVAISAAMSLLQPQVGGAARTDEWILSPDGPIPFAAGRVGVPGSVAYKNTFGPDLMYYGIPSVLSGAGPIDGFEGFLADDERVSFNGSGMAVSSQYAGELWYTNRLGNQPDTALVSPPGLKKNAMLTGWTSAHRLSGKASYLIVMGENSKGTAYPTGEIKPLITFRGLKVYDPRKDSTYPGGSGPHRLNDPSTWTYSANPILWALKWCLGLWEGPIGKGAPQVDYQVGGIGAKLSGIDVPAFVAGANIADANNWTCSAYPNTDDDKSQVLDGFLQAGGCIYAQRAGKISCVQRAAPRTSIVTISAYDTAGPLEIDTAASRIDRINTLRPRFWSEPHRWQMTALTNEVTAESYRLEDGAVRSRGIDYPYVSNAVQAAQLAALQIANTREGIAGVIPLKPHLQRIRPGDAFTITEAGFVLNGLKCLCLSTDYNPATGIVRVSFVSETDGKYPFALGQSPTPPQPQVLTPVPPTYVSPPNPEDWVIEVRPPSAGGVQVPGFDLSGAVGNSTATAVQVEWWMVPQGADPNTPPGPDQEDEWVQAGIWPPTTKTIPIDVPPGRSFWIGLSYIRGQNTSVRVLDGPRLSPGLIAGGLSPDAANKLREDLEAVLDASGPSEELAEVVLETIMNERDALEAEASQRVDDLLQEAAARGTEVALAIQQSKTYIDDYKSQSTLTFATINAMNGGLAATLFEAQSYTTGQVSSAMLTVYTKAQTDAGLASTLQTSRSYTDVYKSEAGLLFSTKTERANGDASAVIEAKSYTDAYKSEASLAFPTKAQMNAAVASTLIDSQSYSDGKLATSLTTIYTKAQTDAGRSATLQEAKSYTDALESYSKLNFSTKAELNGVSGQAALALSAAVGADGKVKAKFGLATQVGNLIVGMESENDGVVGLIKILSSIFQLLSTSSSDRADFADGVWYFYEAANTARAMVGRPFGGSHKLILWCGPASVSLGAEGKDNAYVYVSMNSVGGPRFGGSDVPTGSGAPFSAKANSTGVAMGRLGPGNVKTNLITITVQNAKGPVTYQWFKLSGDNLTITAPTSASTQFEGNIAALQIKQAAFACIVTDTGSGVSTTILATGTVFDNSPI